MLVRASSPEEARERALAMEPGRRFSYLNAFSEEVVWELVELGKAYEILEQTMEDGVEIFSRFLGKTAAQGLYESLRGKKRVQG